MTVCKFVLRGGIPLLLSLVSFALAPAAPVTVASPDGNITIKIETTPDGQLTWSVVRQNRAVLLPAPLGLSIDGKEIGQAVTLGTPSTRAIDEEYPISGNHALAIDHCNEAVIPAESAGIKYEIDVRAFDDGAAVRIRANLDDSAHSCRRRTNVLGTARRLPRLVGAV